MEYKHCPHCGYVSEKTDMYAITEYDRNGDVIPELCSVVYVPHPLKNIHLVDYIGDNVTSEYAEIDFVETLDVPFIQPPRHDDQSGLTTDRKRAILDSSGLDTSEENT